MIGIDGENLIWNSSVRMNWSTWSREVFHFAIDSTRHDNINLDGTKISLVRQIFFFANESIFESLFWVFHCLNRWKMIIRSLLNHIRDDYPIEVIHPSSMDILFFHQWVEDFSWWSSSSVDLFINEDLFDDNPFIWIWSMFFVICWKNFLVLDRHLNIVGIICRSQFQRNIVCSIFDLFFGFSSSLGDHLFQ